MTTTRNQSTWRQQAAELVETLEWPGLVTIPLVAGAAGAALAYTVRHLHLTQRALHAGEITG